MPVLRLPSIDGGLNISDLEHKIQDNQSPSMCNMWFRDRTLSKRWGQEKLSFTDGEDPLALSDIYAVSKEFEGYVCIHAGSKLYKWDTETNVLTDIATIAAVEGVFAEFNGRLYYLDGTQIWQIEPSWECSAVAAHVPLVYINCAPDLSQSDAVDAFNLIGAGFEVHYNGDGASTVYNICSSDLLPLAETEITVKADGSALTLEDDYSWDNETGEVTFVTAPAAGTNNVEITAYLASTGKLKIAGCNTAIPFGGESGDIEGGSRLFVMGNPAYPRTYWYSDLGASQSYGAAYWPDDQYEELNQNNDAITAAGKQAGSLIILKERSLFAVSYNFDGQEVFYPVREFNSTIGCDIPGSVQLIDNNLVFANTYGGVFMIINTSGSAEENVKPLSGNINGSGISRGLLDEPDLGAAASTDYDRKYWLSVNGNVYLWDYDLTPYILTQDALKAQKRLAWFKLGNINAKHWLGKPAANDTGLWYSDGSDIAHFIYYFNDFGEGIDAWWKSKSFDFNQPMYQKLVQFVAVSIRADSNSKMTVTVSNEKKTAFYFKEIEVESFSWALSDWTTFSWNVQRFSKPYRLTPKMKKKYYCQIWVTGGTANRDMGITDMEITYDYGKMVK